ncbi:MAG: hypothetical protein GX446_18425 [Chthonomonadales bacterium]|nr:hypothetical protein [Chthonomonadales bacterium]
MPELTYKGELVAYPGPWAFQIPRAHIILVSDQELKDLSDPDKVLDLSLTFDKHQASLRQLCEQARASGQRTLILAFDHFFSQYRPGQHRPRELTPDMDEYIERIAQISKFAQQYGLGLELSLLSPLEVGPAYAKQTGESGVWMHYRKGYRDPATGAYSVQLWKQRQWAHNKGVVQIEDAGVRVFAFKEQPIRGTQYRVVEPSGIIEITDTATVSPMDDARADRAMNRIVVAGKGRTDIGPLDRVLVVQQYKTPEMDYFSPKALPYLKNLVDKYAKAGVRLHGLYADEMHIQQDWSYFGHHENGEFAMRYVTPNLARRYAELYGPEYADMARYMIYFVYGQEDWASDTLAKSGTMHVMGPSPEQVRRTALFRARYYRLLQDGVTDLFADAKRHAEKAMGHRLESRAHATWAESPTIDQWRTGPDNMYRHAYEYTSNFVWSNTVHQSASACSDYFKWGDFLTGNGNDHAECGWLDRNYVGLSLACSTGILNDVPYSYAAHWGMPNVVAHRRTALVSTYGASGSPLYGLVQDMQHRDVDVLMLYPLDLVAVEERFGSWMTQYGYANLISQDKLVELGRVRGGAIEIRGRRFTTLVATFEPFPTKGLLALIKDMLDQGGRVIWSGPPPVLSREGEPVLALWCDLFGVDYAPEISEGRIAPGRVIAFEGKLGGVPAQAVLTDFLVDSVYPIKPRANAEVVARTQAGIVGTLVRRENGAQAVALGFRPRDDQSQSLGYESRWWFEILNALGAYPASGEWTDTNDNTEYLSRTTPYLWCRFPNGAVAVAPHFRTGEESWPGGFARNAEQDAEIMKNVAMPSEAIELEEQRVNGHTVTYRGTWAMTFRKLDGVLAAFAGSGCDRITLDGKEIVFADRPIGQLAWAPVLPDRRVPGGAVLQAMVYGTGKLSIPLAPGLRPTRLYAEGPTPGSRGPEVPCKVEDGALRFEVTSELSGRWLYAVE